MPDWKRTKTAECTHTVSCMTIGVFIFSAPLTTLYVCITAEKWTLTTKDVQGKRVGERLEEYACEHKHSRVGIYSKRISHLIKTSPQLPGGLCHTKAALCKILHSATKRNKSIGRKKVSSQSF